MLRAMEEKMTLKKMHLFLAAELLLIFFICGYDY